MKGVKRSIRERFIEKIELTDGCWNWIGAIDDKGYGRLFISYTNNKRITGSASHVSYELFVGPITDGLWVLHKCDNRRCVNPYHLFLGTHQDNMNDMVAKDRHPTGTRCYNAILTEEIVRDIKLNYQWKDIPLLSIRFGVNRSTLRDIFRGRTWVKV